MIKPQSLRIGNYVTVNNPKHHPKIKDMPLVVTGINETSNIDKSTYAVSLKHRNQVKNEYYSNYCQFIKFIEPIPLTEQWLIDFRFEKRSDGFYSEEINNVRLRIYENDNIFRFALNNWCTLHIKYVHSLQNLIFELSGKELTKQ